MWFYCLHILFQRIYSILFLWLRLSYGKGISLFHETSKMWTLKGSNASSRAYRTSCTWHESRFWIVQLENLRDFKKFLFAAAQADGIDLWENRSELRPEKSPYVSSLDRFLPRSSAVERNRRFLRWKEAVQRSFGWARSHENRDSRSYSSIYDSLPAAIFVCSTFLLCKVADMVQQKQSNFLW